MVYGTYTKNRCELSTLVEVMTPEAPSRAVHERYNELTNYLADSDELFKK